MTLGAAPETSEAAMSLNTMAYSTSIALGALFGGLLADGLGVRSAPVVRGGAHVRVRAHRGGDRSPGTPAGGFERGRDAGRRSGRAGGAGRRTARAVSLPAV
jgi:hypothetical protein